MQKRDINIWWGGLTLILGVLLLQQFWAQGPVIVPYSSFHAYLEQGQVKQVLVGSSSLEAELKTPTPDGHSFIAAVRIAPDLYEDLAKYGAEVSGKPDSGWLGALAGWLLPMLAFFAIWWFMLRRMSGGGAGMGGGLLGIGKSKAKIFVEQGVKTSFGDVAGVDEAKEELREIVEFLKKPKEYGRLGAHIPRGILLVGPPGTGKTMLARAVAGEAGVPFFSTNGSEFVEMFVGVGAARVRDLFEQARQNAPCIIFIDEIDALGRARGIASMGGADEKEQTLNQLLAEMDGFDRGVPMVLLAATNRPEILDPALLRAGRFDRQVLLDRPDKRGRAQILAVYLKKLTLAADVDIERLASLTPGFTGADIANLANEAAVVATRHGAESISAEDFTAAIERMVAGLEKKSRIISPAERRIVAYHEMGHALVAMAIPGCDPVQKVSIIPRGIGALGYTMQRPLEDRFLMTRAELDAKMTVLLGGRAAELIALGECSTGAQDDLAKATDIARAVALRYGLEESLGPVAYDTESGQFLESNAGAFWRQRRYSEATAREIDQAVHAMLEAALRRAQAILIRNRAELEAGTAALLEKETLAGEDLPRPHSMETGSAGIPQSAELTAQRA